jgi:hypothetical protein
VGRVLFAAAVVGTAPMADFGRARLMGDYFRRPQLGIAVWSLAMVLGMVQSSYLMGEKDAQPRQFTSTSFIDYVNKKERIASIAPAS